MKNVPYGSIILIWPVSAEFHKLPSFFRLFVHFCFLSLHQRAYQRRKEVNMAVDEIARTSWKGDVWRRLLMVSKGEVTSAPQMALRLKRKGG
jgi:hypothetical protein